MEFFTCRHSLTLVSHVSRFTTSTRTSNDPTEWAQQRAGTARISFPVKPSATLSINALQYNEYNTSIQVLCVGVE